MKLLVDDTMACFCVDGDEHSGSIRTDNYQAGQHNGTMITSYRHGTHKFPTTAILSRLTQNGGSVNYTEEPPYLYR